MKKITEKLLQIGFVVVLDEDREYLLFSKSTEKKELDCVYHISKMEDGTIELSTYSDRHFEYVDSIKSADSFIKYIESSYHDECGFFMANFYRTTKSNLDDYKLNENEILLKENNAS